MNYRPDLINLISSYAIREEVVDHFQNTYGLKRHIARTIPNRHGGSYHVVVFMLHTGLLHPAAASLEVRSRACVCARSELKARAMHHQDHPRLVALSSPSISPLMMKSLSALSRAATR